MSVVSLVTLIGAGLLVVAVAITLIAVIIMLRRTLKTLGTINVGLRAIAQRVEPLEPLVGEINSDLSSVRDRLVSALPQAREEPPEKEVAS
ncbi:MAG TPA: hypothetical protein VE975_07845 [Actinomycetota bacterium]|jgi:hypothetical protein|nr:hypothetical protein [Actinomycetota bacterium]